MQGACTSSMYQRGGDCLDQAAFRTSPPASGSVPALFGAYTVSLLLILSWVLFTGVHHRVLQLIGHLFGDVRETKGSPASKKTAKRSHQTRKKKASPAKKPDSLGEAAASEDKASVSACAAVPDEDDDLEAGYEIIHRSDATTDGGDSRTQ